MLSITDNQESLQLPPRPVVKPVQRDNIPKLLKDSPRWLVWRYELRGNDKGEWRWTKVPYSPSSDGENWAVGKANDLKTCASFEQAWLAYTDPLDPEYPQLLFDGIGFVLGDGIVGVDLDKCRDKITGQLDAWASEIINTLRSYTDISPSEKGVKVFAHGVKPGPRCRTGHFEMYDENRFFTVTGDSIGAWCVEHRDPELLAVYKSQFPDAKPDAGKTTEGEGATANDEMPTCDFLSPSNLLSLITAPDDDIELWIKASADDKLWKLHLGDWRGDYSSQSEAEMAYVNRFAYWCGPDPVRLDRMYRNSDLLRSKWDERRPGGTVGSNLIAKVLATKETYYDWQRDYRLYRLGAEGEQIAGEVNVVTRPVISPAAPLDAAKMFLADQYHVAGMPSLLHQKSNFFVYADTHYRTMEGSELRSVSWKWLGRCKQLTKKGEIEPYQPNARRVHDFSEALRACCELPVGVESPCWTDGRGSGREVVAFSNGLFDLEKFLRCEPALSSHTPAFFALNCLPFGYDPEARCPQWSGFLNDVLEDDREQIDALAEWFGYCLTFDTTQQKLALLHGPPRSGKGTTIRMLGHLMGGDNSTPITMSHLGSAFGLECLVGKMAGLMGDAHMPSERVTEMLERFKGIVGEDEQIINPKGKPAFKQKLYVRFTIAVNTMPKMPDASAAMRPRLLVLRYRKSFEGKEDAGLDDRLKTELPGITNWALEGLRRLRQRGRFVQPAAGQQLLDQFTRASSPIKAFIEECCEVEVSKDVYVPKKDLYRAWCQWCENTGHKAGSNENFGTNLFAAVPSLQTPRPTIDGDRVYCYQNIKLKEGAAESLDQFKFL